MKFGSVCSGIEAASTAWEPLGWTASWFAEIEPFPSAVLAHHWPDTPNLGDFTAIRHKIASGDLEAPDVLVGGTPCQAFSVAGLRKSLDDQRGQLTIQFVGLADAIDDRRRALGLLPSIIVWENVPGVLNTADNAFGCFLAAVAGNDAPLVPSGGRWTDAGFVRGPRRSLAWRVQDAQYHGLAQRRRRVFLVASSREGFRPEQVLFEFDGVRRDSPPSREPREGASANASEGTGSVLGRTGVPDIAGTLDKGIPGLGPSSFAGYTHHIVDGFDVQGFGHNAQSGVSSTLKKSVGEQDVAVSYAIQGTVVGPADHNGPGGIGIQSDLMYTQTKSDVHAVALSHTQAMQVRRLTPEECEKLQGFPVGHTQIPWRGNAPEDCPDGPRYKALGNSMAVPCMSWIAKRIIKHLSGEI